MYPPEHFLVAFLPVTVYTLVRYRRPPTGVAILVLLFATQLPDLVDKPLAWTFGVIPSGRMLAHSLVIAVPVVIAVVYVAHRRGYGALGNTFAVGYFAHLAGDFYPVLSLGRDYYFFPNLFWPLMAANPDEAPSFAANMPDPGLELIVSAGVIALVCAYALADSYRRMSV